jgi:hypothetical protein
MSGFLVREVAAYLPLIARGLIKRAASKVSDPAPSKRNTSEGAGDPRENTGQSIAGFVRCFVQLVCTGWRPSKHKPADARLFRLRLGDLYVDDRHGCSRAYASADTLRTRFI